MNAWRKYSRETTAGQTPETAWQGGTVWALDKSAEAVKALAHSYGLHLHPNSEAGHFAQVLYDAFRADAKAVATMADKKRPQPQPEEPT